MCFDNMLPLVKREKLVALVKCEKQLSLLVTDSLEEHMYSVLSCETGFCVQKLMSQFGINSPKDHTQQLGLTV